MDFLELPIILKNAKNNMVKNIYYDKDTTNVSVRFIIYDKKKKTIIKIGESYPLPSNSTKISIHAEKVAIKECLRIDPKNKYNIYIWRWSKDGKIKKKTCCIECTKFAKKLNFDKRIFTFENERIISAIEENPEISFGYTIKN